MIRRIILYAILFALVVIGYWLAFQPKKKEAEPVPQPVPAVQEPERGEGSQ